MSCIQACTVDTEVSVGGTNLAGFSAGSASELGYFRCVCSSGRSCLTFCSAPIRVSRWRRRHQSERGGTKLPCASWRSRPNAAPSVRFRLRETVRNAVFFWTYYRDSVPTLCCLLQVDVCTCSALCVGQSGAGCVESRGTESVWETTGLDDTHKCRTSGLHPALN